MARGGRGTGGITQSRLARQQEILDASEELFFERSFDGTSIATIADKAKIAPSGVYRYFSGKEEILAALIDRATDEVLEQVGPPLEDPRAELSALVSAHIEFALTHPRLADIWQREHHILRDDRRVSVERRHLRYIERWVSCLDICYPGHPRGDLVTVVRAAHAVMTSDTTRRTGSSQSAQLADLLHSMVVWSLQALTNEPPPR